MGFVLATPFLRVWRTTWGTTRGERERSWSGDDLIPNPTWQATMAVTIKAPLGRVWPWLAQLGQGRGGFYSYQGLENLAGCRIDNATTILEEHQTIAPGDPVRLHPNAPPLVAALVEPGRALVLSGNPSDAPTEEGPPDLSTSWALILEPEGEFTRLVSRTRYRHGTGLRNALMGGPALIEPISFVMTRKMLRVIRSLAQTASGIPGSSASSR